MVYALGLRRANDVPLALLATVVVLSALRTGAFWRNEVSRSALARPDCYGGSRYLPLHSILHTAFMKVFGNPLWHDFQTQRFAAVVLETNPQTERARALYRSVILGERFVQEMDRNYEVAGAVGTRTVYLPRKPAPANLGNPENLVNPGNPANHD